MIPDEYQYVTVPNLNQWEHKRIDIHCRHWGALDEQAIYKCNFGT
jgi:hypothetical protein